MLSLILVTQCLYESTNWGKLYSYESYAGLDIVRTSNGDCFMQEPLKLDLVISFPDHGFHLRFDPWSQVILLFIFSFFVRFPDCNPEESLTNHRWETIED